MSTSRGSSAVQTVPAGSRKIVQSLKEIVNCPDGEIYATLKECNMDPNEAVNRLLVQDPFHEVKSKREKKKEGKDTSETKSRGPNNNTNRGGKTGSDRYFGRGGSTSYSSSESSAPLHSKPTYKKENGSTLHATSVSSAPVISSRGPPNLRDVATTENKGSSLTPADGASYGFQPPVSVYHSAWSGAPGHVSMADIVKMGRPNNKTSTAPNAPHHNVNDNPRYPEVHEPGVSSVEPVPVIEEWPSIEKPVVTKVLPVPDYPTESGAPLNGVDAQSESEDGEETEEEEDENHGSDDVSSLDLSSRKVPEDELRSASLFENDMYQNMGSSYQPQGHGFEQHEVDDSVTQNFQQISINKDEKVFPSEEDVPSVVIPDHLQVQTADCSHLSFGSFGSIPVQINNSDEPHTEADISSVGYTGARNSEYFVDDSIRGGTVTGSYNAPSASQQEELKPESGETGHGNQYPFTASNPDFAYEEGQQLNAALSQSQMSSQMQNINQFSNVMQSYPSSLPSTLLASNVHSSRESELQYSQYLLAQSMAAKYGNSLSSIGGSTPEALTTSGFSSTQPAPPTLSGTNNLTSGPTLPQQHLAVHPYSQPTIPLGPFTNMIGYPFLPQSYTYMPSAFQQTFTGNNAYHLPLYKNSVSASSLPQSATIAPGYGGFNNNTNIPRNFPMNQPAGTNLSYDEVLSSQYKDLISLQQNENSGMWVHGPNSRTLPANTFYNYQGQNQQPGGFRQGQQASQNYAYNPNFYHSQAGNISLDQQQQQQQNPREGGPQGQPKQSQIWQNSY